jgi:hypothetical protein
MGDGARVAISNDLVLDFSGLFAEVATGAATGTQEPLLGLSGSRNTAGIGEPVEGKESGLEGQQAKALYLDNQRAQEDHQRSLEVYREYQDNTKKSSQLQTEILKGIKAGEDVYSLFLKAAKAVSLMTHNSQFYSQIEADIGAIYGRGLNCKPPLQKELQEAKGRLQRLLEAEQREPSGDSRERIHRAVKAHQDTIADLEARIARAGE